MLPVRRINQSILLSLEMLRLSIFRAYIFALRVCFSRFSCLFFKPTSLLRESILVESFVYFSSLHTSFASLFQSSLLYIIESYILASRVYFSRFFCLFFNPTSSLHRGYIQFSRNKSDASRDTVTLVLNSNSRW